jgi:hypothetical protein
MIYDLCFAWNWEYDSDFAQLFENACRNKGLSLLQITPDNLESMVQALTSDQLRFQAFLDRASDSDERFLPFVQWAKENAIHRFNRFRIARRASNKVISHYQLIQASLHTPYTIILPAFHDYPDLSPFDLVSLGTSFTIKPAHGGGGLGVITAATSWEQVLMARQEYPDDQYLLQAQVTSAILDGREAWFRVIYCEGIAYPCWWNTHTHIYTPLTIDEMDRYHLHPITNIMTSIENICELDLFSTEIALTLDGLFMVVDYVNDPIDLRLQSKATDGVPDQIVSHIAESLVERVSAMVIPTKNFSQAIVMP